MDPQSQPETAPTIEVTVEPPTKRRPPLGAPFPQGSGFAVSLTPEEVAAYAQKLRAHAVATGMTAVELDCDVCKTTVFVRRGRVWSFLVTGKAADGSTFLKVSLADDIAAEMRRRLAAGEDVKAFVDAG